MRHAQSHPGAILLAMVVLAVDPDPLLEFQARLGQYVILHRTLEVATPPRVITCDPAQLAIAAEALADAIVAARPGARRGDIFTPEVTRVFRDRILEALGHEDIDRVLADLHEGEDFRNMHAAVYARDPRCRVPAGLPPALIWALPDLPSEIQYRIVGRDLALWDEHAMMIIDFIADAFPDQSFASVPSEHGRSSCTL